MSGITVLLCAAALIQPAMIGEQSQVTPNGGQAGDLFGSGAALDGDTAVVGSLSGGAGGEGLAYVLERSGGSWEQVAVLTASNGMPGDLFGISVDLHGDTIVVGAMAADVGPGTNQGLAYVYVRPEGGWTDMSETARLRASPAAVNDQFGRGVSIWEDTIVVGAPQDNLGFNADQGAVYVYVRPEGGWVDATQTARLTASDAAAEELLGVSVEIAGDTIVAGAMNADNSGVGTYDGPGAAYVFVRPGGGWASGTETAKLTADDGAAEDQFGYSVAASEDIVVVGAINDGNTGVGSIDGVGSAYVFERPAGGWADAAHDAKLVYSNGEAGAYFGYAAAVLGDRVLVGAPNRIHTPGMDDGAGAAYFYLRPAGGWNGNLAETAELMADDAADFRYFGFRVAMTADWLMIGAPAEGAGATETGSAYFSAIDGDGDGVANHADPCPDDPAKLDPGTCGCGAADVDSDGDGAFDCEDECPDDAEKTGAGDCGCGAAETDSDGDGVADCADNCADVVNAGQEDADGDGTGEACSETAVGDVMPADCCGGGLPAMLPLMMLAWRRSAVRARRVVRCWRTR